MEIMAFGKKRSGERLFKPVDEEQFVNSLAAALPNNAPTLSTLSVNTARNVQFRGEVRRRVRDAGDPRQAGWSFLVAKDDPQREKIIQILKPLAVHRGMENPADPLVFDKPEDNWDEWLEYYYALDLEGKKVPHYVLMVGGPELLPFHFQSLLDTVANVGRLAFDSTKELKQYVDKVIRLETAPDPLVKRQVILFAPEYPPDEYGRMDPTHYSRDNMVKPLNEFIRQQLNFQTTALMGDDATKKNLLNTLRGAQPALVYTASHGLGPSGEPLDEQKRNNGAICCQLSGSWSSQDWFTAEDVPMNEPFLEGAVFFQFACFGYGTPAESDYSHWLPKGMLEKYAEVDFVAALPKRLLAHPRGPIAYLGHLDTALLHGFTDQDDPDITACWHDRISPYVHAVKALLEVQPSALAMEDMNAKFSYYNGWLTNLYNRLKKGIVTWTPDLKKRFLDSWMIRSDAQNYLVFGDPAARLRIPEE
jgi:hypothetical protein